MSEEHEMTVPQPTEHNRWLQRFVGKWKVSSPSHPGHDGEEIVRAMGELHVICETKGAMPGGGEMEAVMTLCHDPDKDAFAGSFLANVMGHYWIYTHGERDGDKLHMYATGPAMSGEGEQEYRDTFELLSDDHRRLSSHMKDEDGSWTKFMEANYERLGS